MISIIIRIYNGSKFIHRCLSSILNQTYSDFEIVCINDGSTDNTYEELKKLPDSRITLVSHDRNLGIGEATLTGLNNSSGGFLMFVDIDDWLEPNCVETIMKTLNNTDADIIRMGVNIYKNYKFDSQFVGRDEVYIDDWSKFCHNQPYHFLNNKIIKRYLFETTDYLPLRYNEDILNIVKMLYRANKLQSISYIGYNYLDHELSISHSASDTKNGIYYMLAYINMYYFFKKENKLEWIRWHRCAWPCWYNLIDKPTAEHLYYNEYTKIQEFIKKEGL